jgi:hypothetical protein
MLLILTLLDISRPRRLSSIDEAQKLAAAADAPGAYAFSTSLSLSLLVCLSVLLHVDDTVSRCVLAAHDSL